VGHTLDYLKNVGAKIAPRFFASRDSGTLTDSEFWGQFFRAATAAGVTVTPMAAMGVPTVYACVNAISRSMASLPLKLYRSIPGGGKEEAKDHYLYTLLHDAPSSELTSVRFRRAVQANAALRQAGYALIVRNGLGEVAELRPIPNKDIVPQRELGTKKLYYLLDGVRVDANSVLQISGLTLDGVQGLDTTVAVREAIGLAIALQDHGARFFSNASTPTVALEMPVNMSPEQVQKFAEKWDELNTGTKNAHKRSILWGGAKIGSVPTVNNEQSQFLEAKVHQDKAICQAFGVPQIKAGITDAAHFNNVEQENQNYVTDTLIPWAREWEQSLNQKLLQPSERGVLSFEFVFDALLRGNTKERFESYQLAIQNGIMSRNEARAKENLNPIAGGERFLVPLNMQILDASGNPVAPQEEKPATEDAA
jgi:HK97 family phage portal protein